MTGTPYEEELIRAPGWGRGWKHWSYDLISCFYIWFQLGISGIWLSAYLTSRIRKCLIIRVHQDHCRHVRSSHPPFQSRLWCTARWSSLQFKKLLDWDLMWDFITSLISSHLYYHETLNRKFLMKPHIMIIIGFTLHFKTNTFDPLSFPSPSLAQIHVHYNWIHCASMKVFQKKSQELINKKTHPAYTRASGCVWLLGSPDIQLWGSIMWDFCLKTDSLRAFKPNFDMQQILFLLFLCLNPYLCLLSVNAFRLIEALHLCHSVRTNPLKPFVLYCDCSSEAPTAVTAYQWMQ